MSLLLIPFSVALGIAVESPVVSDETPGETDADRRRREEEESATAKKMKSQKKKVNSIHFYHFALFLEA